MVATASTMLPLGTPLPDFRLPDPEGRRYGPEDFAEAEVLVVAFICNHCPFVKHIGPGIADFARDYAPSGVAMIAVSANDVASHPADSPEHMREEAERLGFVFPYLYDESQAVAKAFRAACTPEFYVFDRERKLAYRGRFDGARPGNDMPVTGAELRHAVEALIGGGSPSPDQEPSMGCNIKWKPGNEPDYIG